MHYGSDTMSASSLKDARERAGVTRPQAAAALGVTERTIFRLEAGHQPVKRAYLLVLADLYHVAVDQLVNGQDSE